MVTYLNADGDIISFDEFMAIICSDSFGPHGERITLEGRNAWIQEAHAEEIFLPDRVA